MKPALPMDMIYEVVYFIYNTSNGSLDLDVK